MKYAATLAVVLSFSAVPAFAEDGNVSESALQSLGLADIQSMTDEEGMEVRGMSGSAMAMGLSLVTGLVIDPATKSFVFGADANAAMSTAENAGKQIFTQAQTVQSSSVALSLNVVTSTSSFSGVLVGGAGGAAFGSSR